MDCKKTQFPMHIAVFVLLLLPATALTGSLDLSWHSINSGGKSTGGSLELMGTIGQPDAGYLTGSTIELDGGFLAGASGGKILGDCDSDGDVDLDDYVCFEQCFAGPEMSLQPGCEVVDFDTDNDVDMADFGEFASALTVN